VFDLCDVFQVHIPGIKGDLFLLCFCCDLSGTALYKFDVGQKMDVISRGQYIALNMSSYWIDKVWEWIKMPIFLHVLPPVW
jgi:hypothetical protein